MTWKLKGSWTFLVIVAALYMLTAAFSPGVALESLAAFVRIFLGVIPVIILVFGIMFISNILLDAKGISRHLGEGSGIRGWVFAIGGGILSAGPVYMWYPLLAELRKKGMKDSLAAAFLYNRAVKIPLMPLMLFYFGWAFTALLTAMMVAFSVLNGVLVGKIQEKEGTG